MPGSIFPKLQPQEVDLEVFTYALVYENDDGEAQAVLESASANPSPRQSQSCGILCMRSGLLGTVSGRTV